MELIAKKRVHSFIVDSRWSNKMNVNSFVTKLGKAKCAASSFTVIEQMNWFTVHFWAFWTQRIVIVTRQQWSKTIFAKIYGQDSVVMLINRTPTIGFKKQRFEQKLLCLCSSFLIVARNTFTVTRKKPLFFCFFFVCGNVRIHPRMSVQTVRSIRLLLSRLSCTPRPWHESGRPFYKKQ